jgi:hypothetical protein
VSPDDLEILKHMMNGATPPDFAVRLLEDICQRTNLDWKARHVYLQKRRSKNGADTWSAVLSIDGFRTVGARHPEFAGQEGPLFVTTSDGTWTDIPPEGKPYAAKVGIRKRNGITTWGVAKFGDYYAGMMWDKFPSTMTAKCAEMLAWRKTFPETFGGLYGDAEMQQTEKTAHPKDVVKAIETIGEAAPPETPREPHRIDTYKQRLQDAKSLLEVQAIGKEIQKDKKLELVEVEELHLLYTKMKKEFS